MMGLPFAFTFFSTLHAGAAISAHAAPCNLRLRVHVPLVTPPAAGVEQCGMRVSDQIVPWNEGQAVLFDDSYEHETRNRTDHERVVLLFDVWHPELTLRERESIIDMFGSVASGEGGGA